MARLHLPDVTLCAATSVNLAATLAAMRRSMEKCEFGLALLFTDQPVNDLPAGIELIEIERLDSARAYSRFLLTQMTNYITTSHALIVQWDGFVLRPQAWDATFLDYDYIGAVWPQFSDGACVGNGGFSLRSKRLMDACQTIASPEDHPEDVAICRTMRPRLEKEYGLRFADPATAAHFSYERTVSNESEFGFHGVFNMPTELGAEAWWETYRMLDERTTLKPDFRALIWFALRHKHGVARAWRMICDQYL